MGHLAGSVGIVCDPWSRGGSRAYLKNKYTFVSLFFDSIMVLIMPLVCASYSARQRTKAHVPVFMVFRVCPWWPWDKQETIKHYFFPPNFNKYFLKIYNFFVPLAWNPFRWVVETPNLSAMSFFCNFSFFFILFYIYQFYLPERGLVYTCLHSVI